MNSDLRNTFRQEAEHRGFDPDYLLALARKLEIPAPPTVDDLADPDGVMAQLDLAVLNREIVAVHVANFKSFGKTPQRFPIAPTTLLFGPNSAGKSSLMQALLFASHVQSENEFDVKHPKKGGTVVDLGGFDNIQHRHQPEASIVLGFEFAHHLRRLDDEARPAIWWVTLGCLAGGSSPTVLKAELQVGGLTLVSFNRTRHAHSGSHSITLNFQHPWIEPRLHAFAREALDLEDLPSAESEEMNLVHPNAYHSFILPFWDLFDPVRVATSFSGLVPQEFKLPHTTDEIDRWEKTWLPGGQTIDVIENKWVPETKIKLRPRYRALVAEIRREVQACAVVVHHFVPRFLKGIGYLSSTRIQPGRDFENVTPRDVNFDLNGGASWQWLASSEDGGQTRRRLNRWFAELDNREKRGLAKYQFDVAYDLNQHLTEEVIETEIQNYLMEKNQEHEEARATSRDNDAALEHYAFPFDKLDATEVTARIRDALKDKPDATTHHRLTIQDGRTNTPVTTSDIGVGIQFLIPVLVEFFSGGHPLKIIEEPELHAHPALQAELGDALIEGALSDKRTSHGSRFLIETHSEHLILRVLRRIREASEGSNKYPKHLPKVRPDDVAVIYAEPSAEGTILHHLKISEDGDFIDRWPAGFFTERADELF